MANVMMERLAYRAPEGNGAHDGPLAHRPIYAMMGKPNSQAARRAKILSSVRALFAEGGVKNLTIRKLIERSGISAPTVYKLMGARDHLIEEAVLEPAKGCLERAPIIAEAYDINSILGYAEALWVTTKILPSYSRHTLDLMTHEPGGRRVDLMARQMMIRTLVPWIRDLCPSDRIDRVGTAEDIAIALEGQIRLSFIDWTAGAVSFLQLRRRLAKGIAIILSGLVDDEEFHRIRLWLARLETETDWPVSLQ